MRMRIHTSMHGASPSAPSRTHEAECRVSERRAAAKDSQTSGYVKQKHVPSLPSRETGPFETMGIINLLTYQGLLLRWQPQERPVAT